MLRKRSFPSKILSWYLFDFGLSSFPTLILTFFYGAYFANVIAINPTEGAVLWGITISFSSLASLLLFLCILMVNKKNKTHDIELFKKFYFLLISFLFILLFFNKETYAVLPLIFVSFAFVSFEFLNFFYNVTLSKVSNLKEIGLISNLGWAYGYFGGLISLGIVILFLKLSNNEESLTYIGPFVAFWIFFFCRFHMNSSNEIKLKLPPFKTLMQSIFRRKISSFILSYFFFNNGVICTFIFAGLYASQVLSFSESQILVLGVFINLSGAIGCISMGYVEEIVNTKNSIKISLGALTILTILLLRWDSLVLFWIIAMMIGFFIGPIQASSRAFLCKGIKKNDQFGVFAFYSALGNFCSILGPFLISQLIIFSDSLRLSLYLIPLYYLIGLVLIFRVRSNV